MNETVYESAPILQLSLLWNNMSIGMNYFEVEKSSYSFTDKNNETIDYIDVKYKVREGDEVVIPILKIIEDHTIVLDYGNRRLGFVRVYNYGIVVAIIVTAILFVFLICYGCCRSARRGRLFQN